MFAGITVCIALLGMLTVGVGVLSGVAIGASVAVLFPMLAAQTLLPALVALGVPFFSMRQGTADYSTDPTSTTMTTYRGYEMLVQGFGPGFSGPLQLVATVDSPAQRAEFARVVSAAAHRSEERRVGKEC